MKSLRYYQKEAVEKICDFFISNKSKAKMYISTGLGKTAIIGFAIQEILLSYRSKVDISIAVLTPKRGACEQIKALLSQENFKFEIASYIREWTKEEILVTTYQDVIKNQCRIEKIDLIICDEAQFVKNEDYFSLLIKNHTKFLGLLQNTESSEGWFYNSECLFSYLMGDAVRDGYDVYFGEQRFIQSFLLHLLEYQGYTHISKEVKISNTNNNNMRVDIIAQKDDKTIIIEVKFYRNLHNSKSILNNALKQILSYKYFLMQNNNDKNFSFIIILPCKVSEELQNEIYNQYQVIVWDISNLIYLCEGKKDLINSLTSCISYPLLEIKSKKPLNIEKNQKEIIISEAVKVTPVEKYLEKLKNCKPGKINSSDRKYEIICTEIIKYLFETEFFRISEQHRTDDNMFRMDLLCSLKGTTEFWKFLISFYHTKFVVFEYKNYSDYISQNLIYTTEKYLFPVALRNVAFIVSRKGFDENAENAALGCLRESGKLIISIDDNDLIKMLSMKEKGEEPSDYLLDKVENLLMSVSK